MDLVTRLGRALADVDLDALRDLLGAPGDAGRAQLMAVLAEVRRGEVRDAIAFGAMALAGESAAAAEDPLRLDSLTDQYIEQEDA